MADLKPYHFEPEHVPNTEDSGNKEVNDWLQSTVFLAFKFFTEIFFFFLHTI